MDQFVVLWMQYVGLGLLFGSFRATVCIETGVVECRM